MLKQLRKYEHWIALIVAAMALSYTLSVTQHTHAAGPGPSIKAADKLVLHATISDVVRDYGAPNHGGRRSDGAGGYATFNSGEKGYKAITLMFGPDGLIQGYIYYPE